MSDDDYCELCDLPKSQCIHGRPPSPPPEKKAAPKPRTRPSSTSRTTTAPARSVNRRWTAPEALKPLVLTVLHDADGELEADAVFQRLGALLEGQLRPGDEELTPEGELRWHYAARRARQSLIADGLMTKGAPGMWRLA